MLVGISEGRSRRFEVLSCWDGYVVQARDVQSARVEPSERMLFRTSVAALAFADLEATLEPLATAKIDGEPEGEDASELRRKRTAFEELARRLHDDGVDARVLEAWAAHDEERTTRRLH